MSYVDDIRKLLEKKPMTVEQIAHKLHIGLGTVNSVTGFEMGDVYEEDDGFLKIIGITYEQEINPVRKRVSVKFTPEVREIVKEMAGKVPAKVIAKEVKQRTGIDIATSTVVVFMANNGFTPFHNEVTWTPEMDAFLLAFKPSSWRGRIEERIKAINEKFGVNATGPAISHRLFKLRRNKNGLSDFPNMGI